MEGADRAAAGGQALILHQRGKCGSRKSATCRARARQDCVDRVGCILTACPGSETSAFPSFANHLEWGDARSCPKIAQLSRLPTNTAGEAQPMSALDTITWPNVRSHYDERVRIHGELLALREKGNAWRSANLLLGISNAAGNYSAEEHALGSENPGGERQCGTARRRSWREIHRLEDGPRGALADGTPTIRYRCQGTRMVMWGSGRRRASPAGIHGGISLTYSSMAPVSRAAPSTSAITSRRN